MSFPFDTVIAGGGLAGAFAVLSLSRHERVLLLEAEHPAAGASGVAAGLVNPLMGRRARPVWRMEEALAAFGEALGRVGAQELFSGGGVLRPAAAPRQAASWKETATAYPAHALWLPADEAAARYPAVAAPHGALLVRSGGAVRVPALVAALLQAARRQGAEVRTGARVVGWGEEQAAASVTLQHEGGEERLRAGRLLLALGGSYVEHPDLQRLDLHRIKGQTVRVRAPGLPGGRGLPPLAGRGYVVPEGDDLVVGSSYEHTFDSLHPSREQTRRILEKAARMLPGLEAADVIEEQAGLRVTVPGLRLPMVGPLPGRRRLWVFTGLGSKGLLMAPLIARDLPRFFAHPDAIPPELRVRSA